MRVKEINAERSKLSQGFKNPQERYLLARNYTSNLQYGSYLSPHYINRKLDKDEVFNYILEKYSDIDRLLKDDLEESHKDIVFSKIGRLCGLYTEDVEWYLRQNHQEILTEALEDLLYLKNIYIKTDKTSLYTYIVNILPFYYYDVFSTLYTNDKKYWAIKADKLSYELIYAPEREPSFENLTLLRKLK